jgi:hypothetical protein
MKDIESEFASIPATAEWFRLRGIAREVFSRYMVSGDARKFAGAGLSPTMSVSFAIARSMVRS